MPKRRYFQEIRPGHHFHSFSLAELIIHLCVTAGNHNCWIVHFARENSVRLVADPYAVIPDCAFVIERSDGRRFSFCVELDNGTERVRSKQDVESIERKIRRYDAHQSQFEKFDPNRYLVLFVTTRSASRLENVMGLVRRLLPDARSIWTARNLVTFLGSDPFSWAILKGCIPISLIEIANEHLRLVPNINVFRSKNYQRPLC